MEYKSYTELKNHILKYDDEIIFIVNRKKYKYFVLSSFLTFQKGLNDKIFKVLNIENSELFCKKSYGYKPSSGCFPFCKKDDYKALTQVTLDLFKLCDNYEIIDPNIWD